MTAPCPSCPWRVDSDPNEIPGLSIEMARNLVHTCPTGAESALDNPMMACHGSSEGADLVCIGWAMSPASEDSLPLRLHPAREYRHHQVADLALYQTFADMLANIETKLQEVDR